MSAQVSVRLFGTGTMTIDDREVPWPARSDVRKLLIYLLLCWPTDVNRNSIVADLWPDLKTSAAKSRLRRAIHRLNVEFGHYLPDERLLKSSRTSVTLNQQLDLSVDHADFIASVTTVDHMARSIATHQVSALVHAVEVARETLLRDYSQEWMATKRAEAMQLRQRALAALTNHFESRLDYGSAAHYALDLARTSPLSEMAYRRVVNHLIGQGAMHEAQSVLRELLERSEKEIGSEPSASVLENHVAGLASRMLRFDRV